MSKPDEIVVVARWQATEETLAEILQHVPILRRESLAEPGCRGFEIFRQLEDPVELLLIERYADAAAQESHKNSKHYRELVAGRIVPLLKSRSVELLQSRS